MMLRCFPSVRFWRHHFSGLRCFSLSFAQWLSSFCFPLFVWVGQATSRTYMCLKYTHSLVELPSNDSQTIYGHLYCVVFFPVESILFPKFVCQVSLATLLPLWVKRHSDKLTVSFCDIINNLCHKHLSQHRPSRKY